MYMHFRDSRGVISFKHTLFSPISKRTLKKINESNFTYATITNGKTKHDSTHHVMLSYPHVPVMFDEYVVFMCDILLAHNNIDSRPSRVYSVFEDAYDSMIRALWAYSCFSSMSFRTGKPMLQCGQLLTYMANKGY